MMPPHDDVKARRAVYAPLMLGVDAIPVHGVSDHWIGDCPTHLNMRLYDRVALLLQ